MVPILIVAGIIEAYGDLLSLYFVFTLKSLSATVEGCLITWVQRSWSVGLMSVFLGIFLSFLVIYEYRGRVVIPERDQDFAESHKVKPYILRFKLLIVGIVLGERLAWSRVVFKG